MPFSSPRARRRWRTHLWLALGSLVAGIGVAALHARSAPREQWSIATAYVGMLWIAASLLIGPLNLLRGRPNPVSSDIRRDIGIWGGLAGLVHVAFGLTVHMRGKMSEYFFSPAGSEAFAVRLDAFGLANHLGLVSGVVLLLLLVLSSDWSLRAMGSARWKRWQRWNYLCAAALVAHGALYQLLEKRRPGLVTVFVVLAIAAAAFQVAGVRAYRAYRTLRAAREDRPSQSRGVADQL